MNNIGHLGIGHGSDGDNKRPDLGSVVDAPSMRTGAERDVWSPFFVAPLILASPFRHKINHETATHQISKLRLCPGGDITC
jgi:hypothetical protein